MGKTNLKDIAELAGVSISTVSRVINDPEQVQTKTREAVYGAMRTLGYQPALKTASPGSRKGAVAIIIPTLDNEFIMDFIVAMEKELEGESLYPLLVNTRDELSLSAFLKKDTSWVEMTEAAVVLSISIDEQAKRFLEENNIPAATVHERCSCYYSVLNNNYLGGFDAAEYLWGKGYRNIGVVHWTGIEDSPQGDRLTGFLTALEKKGISGDGIPRETDLLTLRGGYAATERLLRRSKPDALFYTCDIMAIGGLEYCREKNIRIPEDLAVMGFDDIRMSEAMNLTTMRQFIDAKARAVATHLLGRRRGEVPGEFPEEITITPVVVERQTT